MLIAAYAHLGWGLLFVLLLVAIGLALLAWVLFWASHGFRAAPPRSPRGPTWWLIRLVPLLSILVCFPPMRRASNWSDRETGEPAAAAAATTFDRNLFGYIPSHRWVGQLGSAVDDDAMLVMTIDRQHRWYRKDHDRWVVDWLYMGLELFVLAIVLLPFARARRRGSAEPSAA